MMNFIPATIMNQLSARSSSFEEKPDLTNNRVSASSDPNIKVETKSSLPLSFSSTSVVLVAEVRNFYDLTLREKYPDEPTFNEYIAEVSHKILENMSIFLKKFGGDLI